MNPPCLPRRAFLDIVLVIMPPILEVAGRQHDVVELLALYEFFEVARAPSLAQLAQRLGFDLPNPFARHGELFADLFQRVIGLLPDAEAHAQDLPLTWRERRQRLARLFAQVALDRGLHRRGRQLILDEVAERALLLVADTRTEAPANGNSASPSEARLQPSCCRMCVAPTRPKTRPVGTMHLGRRFGACHR